MLVENEDAEECIECGEYPRRICQDCGCCRTHCECDEEGEEEEDE